MIFVKIVALFIVSNVYIILKCSHFRGRKKTFIVFSNCLTSGFVWLAWVLHFTTSSSSCLTNMACFWIIADLLIQANKLFLFSLSDLVWEGFWLIRLFNVVNHHMNCFIFLYSDHVLLKYYTYNTYNHQHTIINTQYTIVCI